MECFAYRKQCTVHVQYMCIPITHVIQPRIIVYVGIHFPFSRRARAKQPHSLWGLYLPSAEHKLIVVFLLARANDNMCIPHFSSTLFNEFTSYWVSCRRCERASYYPQMSKIINYLKGKLINYLIYASLPADIDTQFGGPLANATVKSRNFWTAAAYICTLYACEIYEYIPIYVQSDFENLISNVSLLLCPE